MCIRDRYHLATDITNDIFIAFGSTLSVKTALILLFIIKAPFRTIPVQKRACYFCELITEVPKKRPAGFILQVAFLFTFNVAMLVGAFLSNLPELHSVLFGYRFIVKPHLYKCYRIKNTGKKHYTYTDKNE